MSIEEGEPVTRTIVLLLKSLAQARITSIIFITTSVITTDCLVHFVLLTFSPEQKFRGRKPLFIPQSVKT